MPKQEKVSLECSLPQPVSSIKRITTALPYPADISEALNYSASYVDHAAHLAKHALHQFEQLQKAHSNLHTKAESQAKEIKSLECHVKDHEEDIRGLNSKYAELEKQRARDAKESKAREDLLKKQLADAQAALKAAESYIAKDKVEDIKRDDAHHAHISADHMRIKQAEERATQAEARCVQLQDLLDAANKKLVVAESNLKTTREKLTASEATVAKLTKDLDVEKKVKEQLQVELKQANKTIEEANVLIGQLRGSIKAKDQLIDIKSATIDKKDAEVTDVRAQLKQKTAEVVKKCAEVDANEDAFKLELNMLKAENKELKVHHQIKHQSGLKTDVSAHVVELVDTV